MRHALAAAAAFLLAGCGLLTAEIDVERIDVTVPNNHFPAPATSTSTDWCDPTNKGIPPCVATTVDYNLGQYVPALTEKSVSYDLRLIDANMTLSASAPMTDLSSVQSAVVRVGYMTDAGGAVVDPGTVVASYYKEPGSTPATISVSGNANLDLGPYLDTGNLPVRVEVVLDDATPAFDADIHAGFSLVMKVDWGSYL